MEYIHPNLRILIHPYFHRAEEVGFRLALLKPGIEEKLYIDDIPKISRSKQVDDIEDQRDQVDSGVTSETSDDSDKRSRISSSDGYVDSDLNNSRASISSEDEHKNVKINDGKRHSVTTSDTDHSIDLEPKLQERKSRKTENRVVSSVTIFLKPSKCQAQKKKYFSREELLKLQYPTPDLKNPFNHVFDEIERNTAKMVKQNQHRDQPREQKRVTRKSNFGKFQRNKTNKPSGYLTRA